TFFPYPTLFRSVFGEETLPLLPAGTDERKARIRAGRAERPDPRVEVGDGPLIVGIVEVERHRHAVDQRLELGEAPRLPHAEPVGGRDELEVAVRGGMAEGGRAVAVEDRPVARAAELALHGHGRTARARGRRWLLHRERLGAAAHVLVGAVEEVLLRVRGVKDLEVRVDLIRDARGDGVGEVLRPPDDDTG